MNCDRGRGVVFHDPDDYRAFLDTLLDDYIWVQLSSLCRAEQSPRLTVTSNELSHTEAAPAYGFLISALPLYNKSRVFLLVDFHSKAHIQFSP